MSYNPNNPNGLAAVTASAPVTLSEMLITGAVTQTVVGNNILNSTTGTAAIDLSGYKTASVQVISTGTAGTFIFEGSNDNTNFQAVPVFNQLILTGTPITAAITATASQLIYILPVQFRYLRIRIATTITGGSLQAVSRFTQEVFTPAIMLVAQATAANLNTNTTVASGTITTVGTVTTVGSVTSSQSAIPLIVADVASAAITTTTTTATLTPATGSSYQVNIPVTVVTGTTPTLDVQIQESADTGTNWYAVYDFPRITATGSYNSPVLCLTGNRVRYVQTVSGTTPSFTRAINRLQSSAQNISPYRQMIDRTISLTTLNSNTSSLFTQNCKNAQIDINIGATTVAPALQLQGSDDNGSTWYNIGTPLASTASSTVSSTITNITAQFLRATVTTAGTGTTAGYVLIRGF